jgi:CRP-like cAMP-binding protein
VQLLNFFLSALRPDDLAALSSGLAEVSFAPGQVLFDAGSEVEAIFFPGSACVSVVTVLRDGKAVETATVGRESAVGLMDAVTDQPARSQTFAQISGSAMRLSAPVFRARLRESPSLLRLTLLHVRATSLQAEQGVACNVAHDVHGRLARWLLMTQDRVGADTFPLTQEYMAVMTGVQRSTVSLMAGALKKAGVIDYARGMVKVLDRPALMRHACECYSVVGQQFDDLRTAPI